MISPGLYQESIVLKLLHVEPCRILMDAFSKQFLSSELHSEHLPNYLNPSSEWVSLTALTECFLCVYQNLSQNPARFDFCSYLKEEAIVMHMIKLPNCTTTYFWQDDVHRLHRFSHIYTLDQILVLYYVTALVGILLLQVFTLGWLKEQKLFWMAKDEKK